MPEIPKGRRPARSDHTAALPAAAYAPWAHRLLDTMPEETPAEELALLRSQIASLAATTAVTADAVPPNPTAPQIVRDRRTLRQLAERLRQAGEVVIDLETSSLDPMSGEIVGLGFAAGVDNHYVPTAHRFEQNGQLRPDQLPLGTIMREVDLAELPLIAHNATFEYRWLRRHTGVECRFVWDTMIAARLLRSDRPAKLKELACRELDVPDWEMPKADIERVQFLPIERVARYCAKDVRYTLELYRRQRACLD